MLQTIAEETYQVKGVSKSATLFVNVANVMFNIPDKMIIAYVEKGFISVEIDPVTNEEITKNVRVSNEPNKFSQVEMKDLLDAAGVNYNSGGSNLMIDEMESASNEILKSLITEDSSRFFGLDLAKWV